MILTVFIDLFSQFVVSWGLSAYVEQHSLIKAFNKAVMNRRPDKGLMIHSNCGVNAVAESFSHTLQTQLIHYIRFKIFEEAEHEFFV